MKISQTIIVVLLCLALPHISVAAEYSAYHKDIMEPYGHYKKALALTSKKENKDKALKAVEKFIAGWAGIVEKYQQNPPSEFQNIDSFQEKIERPLAIGKDAMQLLRADEVKKSHTILEEVRYLLWQMRVDAGIISLSDKINDFHEAMEIILDAVAESQTAEELEAAGERYGAWVAIKWAEVAGMNISTTDDKSFKEALEGGRNAIADLRAACQKGDAEAAKKAGGLVKKFYKAIFFMPEAS